MPLTGLSWSLFNWTELEFYGKLSFIKGGLVFADAVNTVSKQYAKEIQTEEFGSGLEGVLTQRRNELFGVVNGVDYSVWNPEVDELLPAHYSPRDLSGKAKCKETLQAEQKLAVRPDTPLIGMISRMVDQKGFDILAECFEELMTNDVQFVLLGTGDPKYHDMFQKLHAKYPDKVAVNITFDNRLAHLIEAGADLFMMPSRYEPCGLNQLYSLKYATAPIVNETGGLKDTVTNVSDRGIEDGTATGFTFRTYHSKALMEAIRRALACYRQKRAWKKLTLNCMAQDWSWTRSAREYIDIYNFAIKRRQDTKKFAATTSQTR
jgi:starch synthase